MQSEAVADPPTSETVGEGSARTLNRRIIFMLLLLVGIVALFLWEPVPLYVLALGIPVVLAAFSSWTGVSLSDALSGFSSEATITILCMFILSEGVNRTGVIQVLGEKLSILAEGGERKQLAAVTGLSGPIAGIINNTPVVAIFIPMVSNLARRVKTSPSKLMIPLSYAAMLGGTLTLIGSSTNLLASDLSARLLDHPISFFEFTGVGVILLVTGIAYLIFVAPRLIPERIDPQEDLAEEFGMGGFLTELIIPADSVLIGMKVEKALREFDIELELVKIVRAGEEYMEPFEDRKLQQEDRLVIRANRSDLPDLLEHDALHIWSERRVSENQLQEPIKGQTLLETAIPKGSFLEGQTLSDVNFVERYDATVLAVRRGEELTHSRMEDIEIHAGDVLLLLATETTVNRLRRNRNFIVLREIERSQYRRSKVPVALSILGGVVALAALEVTSITLSALGGVLVMAATGCVTPNELHESVDWEVIFLLAGLIPLGIAMQETGTAAYLGWWVGEMAQYLPALGALALFYFFTAVMTNLVHKNASIVLMIPIAVDVSTRLGLAPFPFLIAVMLAASTAFVTPVGNHTNLMVYGPGGYRFTDFLRVGLPLQLLLAVVAPVAITLFWSL